MRIFSSKLPVLLAMVLVLPALAACESFGGGWNERSPTVSTPADTQAQINASAASTRLDNAPGITAVPNFPVPQDRDLKVMTSKLSGGSVEIYDLDGPALPGAPVASVQPYYQGIPMATDPRVTVYPIDGYNTGYPGQMAMAPQQTWPNSILPVGDAGMTASPRGWSDEPMNIVDGKLSPSVGAARSSVYFPYGSSSLDRESRVALNSVAEKAKFAPVDRVSVEGYASKPTQVADPVKSKILNLKESMNRAQAVSQNLIEEGVPAEKIKTVAWGDTKPSSGNEAAERRVDIITGYGQ